MNRHEQSIVSNAEGETFGGKFGNINFYASLALQWYDAFVVRGQEPSRADS